MPRFLAPITVGQETVTGTETISGNQIILSGTYGKDSYWTTVSASGGLSADSGSFVKNVSALGFYGDGSKLTGITTGNYLSASGGTLTGALTGTIGVFTTSLSATSLSGVHYGDGSRLTGIVSPVGIFLPLSGGALSGTVTSTSAISSANTITANNLATQNQVQYLSSGSVKVYQFYNTSTNSLDTVFN